MQRKFARAACAGVLATMALIAVLCVVDNEVAHEDKHKEIRGDKLLRQQAQTLNAIRDAKKKGKDMQSFDDMLHKFQHPPDNQLTATLVSQAPKKDDIDVVLAPDQLGIVPAKKHLPSANELNLAPEAKKNPSPLEASLKLADEEYGLIQEYSEEWRPSGQAGLDQVIKSAKVEDEKEAVKADGLKGTSVLSASGLDKYSEYSMDEARDMLFVQVAASDDTGAEWRPKGQGTLNNQLKHAHQAEAAYARTHAAKEDGLKGDGLLSAVGIKQKPKPGSMDDLVPDISADDLMSFTQVEAQEWVPRGQAGMSSAIKAASISDEADAVKADGLGGTDILSASKPPPTVLLQKEAHQDKVANWKPSNGILKGAHKAHQGMHTFHKSKKGLKKHKLPSYMKPHDLDGDTILSAVSMGHHIKKKDAELENFSSGEFDAFALLKD